MIQFVNLKVETCAKRIFQSRAHPLPQDSVPLPQQNVILSCSHPQHSFCGSLANHFILPQPVHISVLPPAPAGAHQILSPRRTLLRWVSAGLYLKVQKTWLLNFPLFPMCAVTQSQARKFGDVVGLYDSFLNLTNNVDDLLSLLIFLY